MDADAAQPHGSVFVTKEMTIEQVVNAYPEAAEIIQAYGLHCVGCHANPFETLEMGAARHGMDDATIASMLADVNEFVRQKQQEKTNGAAHDYTNDAPITLTDKAALKLAELLKSQNKTGWGLKLAVVAGGCSGFTYQMSLAEAPGAGDKTIESGGVRVFIDPASAHRIAGAEIDYVESLQGAGFKVSNPQAKANCGCGKSFN